MKVVATVQVRMNSSRLPGKALKKILGKPVLYYLVERLKRSKLLDEIIVATSTNKENDVLEKFCLKNNISIFRGSEDDVLGRVLSALESCNADIGIEIYGDCPLLDHRVLDSLIEYYLDNKNKYDFVTNGMKTTYPPGLEVEVYPVSSLKNASEITMDPDIREHGTYSIRNRPDIFRIKNIEAPKELFYPELELELDTEEDFYVISKIIENLYPKNNNFSTIDVIEFLDQHPKIRDFNKEVPRRWKKSRVNQN